MSYSKYVLILERNKLMNENNKMKKKKKRKDRASRDMRMKIKN